MAKLVYIASAGHSGSTLLDFIIGTVPRVFSTGEVVFLPWEIGRPRTEKPSLEKEDICTCLKSFEECQVWRKVIEELNEKVGYNIYEDPFRFRLSFINRQEYPSMDFAARVKRYLFCQGFKYPFLRTIPGLFEVLYKRVMENNWMLFDTIGEVCNADYIVDSSKDYIRMKLLHAYRPEDIYVIVLIRSPYGVSYSNLKLKNDMVLGMENWVKLYNKTKLMIDHSHGINYLLVKYEKLCEDPILERKRIAGFLGLPDPGTELSIHTNKYHLVTGNSMRYKGEISIRHDEKWKRSLNEKQIEKIRIIYEKIDPMFKDLYGK